MSQGSELKGHTAVVTGGGRGVGEATATRLARAGAAVIVTARTAREIEAVAARLAGEGLQARAVVCDVTDEAAVERLAREARDAFGAADILINNAGIALASPLHKTSLEDWERVFAVNARGPFLCTRAFLPGMVERGWGRIVNVASTAAVSADRYIGAYAASKHALLGLTRAAAAEVATSGVTVNAVCPGYLDTDMTRQSIDRIVARTGRTPDAAREAILTTSPQHRLITADEVAAAIVYLCGEAARAINGEALVLDGGGLRR